MEYITDKTTEVYKRRQAEKILSDSYRDKAREKYNCHHIKSVQIMKEGAYVEIAVWIGKDELK